MMANIDDRKFLHRKFCGFQPCPDQKTCPFYRDPGTIPGRPDSWCGLGWFNGAPHNYQRIEGAQ